ncbi:hypothetical protein [Methanobacterium aggregans]|uniref:hypothetical protein n=1 Tax=Methanobacterium aggregans TaxID=1615586 RepID=UPI001AEA2C53|nr:hypothetical protein [Methanobacterium aggregans]MBP2045931.1 hypothetical protein [Methanobacterium aggregans]
MGIVDKMEEQLDKRARKRQQDMENLFTYLKNLNIPDLDEILSEVRIMMESGFYNSLINTMSNDKFDKDVDFLGDLPKHRVGILAHDNLRRGGIFTTIFTKSIITVQDTLTLYSFIESVYYIHKNPLEKEDLLNIYFSRLDELLIFGLDSFDDIDLEDLPDITPEYFQALNRVYWEDKKLYDDLKRLMFEVMDFILNYPAVTEWPSKYRVTEDFFIQFLTACNAVNGNRLGMRTEDVIKAYKTFFKLIKTDVTEYKAIPNLIEDLDDHGPYLVCKKCGAYYQFPYGESIDEYSDICECGGKLKYLGNPRE